jgi:hypothetical protein
MSKATVPEISMNTLGSSESKRAYQLAIDDFVIWYRSEPRLAFVSQGCRWESSNREPEEASA